MQKVLVICGPTCVGKTSLSIELAEKLNAEVINGDSMQVYKGMDIGTAKITQEEMRGIPHHLFNIKEINENFSVASFQKLVREKINEISSKNKLPIIVGGTGLYLKAALYDYEFKEENTKYNFEDKSNEELYKMLKEIDPESASKIHINNKKRIIRALEIFYENEKGKEEINKTQNHKPIYDVLFLGLRRDRKSLYQMIDDRVDKMMDDGLLDEAIMVLEKCKPNSTCSQAIGYKELKPFINNEDSLEHCVYRLKMNTHKFVKRQFTWFNHQMDTKWIDVDDKSINQITDDALKIIKEWNHE